MNVQLLPAFDPSFRRKVSHPLISFNILRPVVGITAVAESVDAKKIDLLQKSLRPDAKANDLAVEIFNQADFRKRSNILPLPRTSAHTNANKMKIVLRAGT